MCLLSATKAPVTSLPLYWQRLLFFHTAECQECRSSLGLATILIGQIIVSGKQNALIIKKLKIKMQSQQTFPFKCIFGAGKMNNLVGRGDRLHNEIT